jgi:hypothetical protein
MSSTRMDFARLAPEADRVHAHAMVPHTQVREASIVQRYAKSPLIEAVLYAATYSHQQMSSASSHLVQLYDRSFPHVYGSEHSGVLSRVTVRNICQ